MGEAHASIDKLLVANAIEFVEADKRPEAATWLADLKGMNQDRNGAMPYATIFTIMDTSGDGAMNFGEFCGFMDLLDMNLDYRIMQRMFQYADEDNTGDIFTEEFERAWGYLKADLAEEMLVKRGLD